MDSKTPTTELVSGMVEDKPHLALMVKLTFDIKSNGECTPSEEQLPLIEDPQPYEDVELPQISPPIWDHDLFAFKPGTDVVVQGNAYNQGAKSSVVNAGLKSRHGARQIRVQGNRFLDWSGTTPVFTPAEKFEKIPLRFDHAYGGYDESIGTDEAELIVDKLALANPDDGWDAATRQHYPRNPSGMGYVKVLKKGVSDGLQIPNLDYAFDPVTPERLAIGEASNWINAPLAASFDWLSPDWFPRVAYLGLIPPYVLASEGLQEIKQGWAVNNLLEIESILNFNFHPTLQHGASPCLIHKRLKSGETFELANLFEKSETKKIQLVRKSPKVKIRLTHEETLDCESYLSSIVFRPDDRKVIEVWSARVEVTRAYAPSETENMQCEIKWA